MKGKKRGGNNKTCGYRNCNHGNRVIKPWEPRVYDVKKKIYYHFPCWWRFLDEKRQKEIRDV